MGSALGRLAVVMVAFVVALTALPGAARAQSATVADRACIAYAALGGDSSKVATSPATKWDCSGARPSMTPDRVLFRFAVPATGAKPEYVTFRRAAFERLHVLVVDADGAVRGRYYGLNDLEIGKTGGYVRGDLPNLNAQSRYAIAVIDQPTHSLMLDSVELGRGDPGSNPDDLRLLLLLAALSGMLIMPLAFNIAFYRVLREKFLLWHAAMAVTLLAIISITSGLSAFVVDLGMGTLNTLMALIYGASVSTGAMFAATFIEPGKLHPVLRKALPVCAVWSMAVSGFHALFPFVMRPIQVDIAYLCYLPIMAVFFTTVIDASLRGSRAVRFQIVGWMPLMLVVLLRIVSQVTPVLRPTDAMVLFYIGTVFEALATTLGVADRFMTIRRQRDMARTEADMLEKLSEHDPLTGLLNRRGIEPDFNSLRLAGYDSFALLDLDHFKRVNDDFGHAAGDKVLKAVAEALQNQPDTMAVRMGGEEFALLLRGSNAQERCERMRQAIPVRVARAVPELDRVVTASMGLLELPRSGMKNVGFKEFYAHADKLLYEAKSGGRNRLIAERVRIFVPRRIDRRRAA